MLNFKITIDIYYLDEVVTFKTTLEIDTMLKLLKKLPMPPSFKGFVTDAILDKFYKRIVMNKNTNHEVFTNASIFIEKHCIATRARSYRIRPTGMDVRLVAYNEYSKFLNTLDGTNPLNNTILFMTTNRLDLLKPAVYRKGRVDEVFFVDHPTPERFVQLLNQTSEIKDRIIIENGPTQVEIASTCGCSRETVSRMVKSLAEKGRLSVLKKRYTIRPVYEPM